MPSKVPSTFCSARGRRIVAQLPTVRDGGDPPLFRCDPVAPQGGGFVALGDSPACGMEPLGSLIGQAWTAVFGIDRGHEMWLGKEAIRANIVADMTTRFPARHGNFPDKLKLASLGFPSAESRREWGKALNRASWFTGWFTPSEFLACVTLGPVPGSKDPNLVDLMFNTQTRPPERPASRAQMLSLSDATPAALNLGKAVKPKTKKALAKKKSKASKKPMKKRARP
jgi:hypothetical protein